MCVNVSAIILETAAIHLATLSAQATTITPNILKLEIKYSNVAIVMGITWPTIVNAPTTPKIPTP